MVVVLTSFRYYRWDNLAPRVQQTVEWDASELYRSSDSDYNRYTVIANEDGLKSRRRISVRRDILVCSKLNNPLSLQTQTQRSSHEFSHSFYSIGAVLGKCAVKKFEEVEKDLKEYTKGANNFFYRYYYDSVKKKRTGYETRSVNLGHTQRGGTPTAYDRMLATRYGAAALDLVHEGRFGRLVVLRGAEIADIPLDDALAKPRIVEEKDAALIKALQPPR